MSKVKGGKRSRAQQQQAASTFVEDLDLEPDVSPADYTEEDIVFDRRRQRGERHGDDAAEDGARGLGRVAAVLPSEAHRLEGLGEDQRGGFLEEEELATAAERAMRSQADDDDFNVGGVAVRTIKAKTAGARPSAASSSAAAASAPTIEAVERNFAALSSSDRLQVLRKESPELLKMLEDLKRYLEEVKALAGPLHALLYERKISSAADKNLVSFLETKVQLMLSYCMHVTFYLLLKTEGKKVAGHPVIDALVEIRVYLEKMWPLEEKLQYSLSRLLSGKTTAAARIDEMRPVGREGAGEYRAPRTGGSAEARERRQMLRAQREAEELEREEQAGMTRVRSKKASALAGVGATATVAPLAYREDEDQYFARMAGVTKDEDDEDGEDGEGVSLMEALRRRQKVAADFKSAQKAAHAAAAAEVADTDDDDDDEDYGGGEESLEDEHDMEDTEEAGSDDAMGDEEDFEALWAEERAREEAEAAEGGDGAGTRAPFAPVEVDRRKASKRIESHRGLTKARPKDRKNPRVAQRRKYERGLNVHKANTRAFQPEPEGGFAGVSSIKTGVVRSRKLAD